MVRFQANRPVLKSQAIQYNLSVRRCTKVAVLSAGRLQIVDCSRVNSSAKNNSKSRGIQSAFQRQNLVQQFISDFGEIF